MQSKLTTYRVTSFRVAPWAFFTCASIRSTNLSQAIHGDGALSGYRFRP